MKLDRWAEVGNVLAGYVYDHPFIPAGNRAFTGAVLFIDRLNNEATTLSRKTKSILKIKLLEPGHPSEHVNNPELQQPPKDDSYFLKPEG
jgi:hypothetical protein